MLFVVTAWYRECPAGGPIGRLPLSAWDNSEISTPLTKGDPMASATLGIGDLHNRVR
jgi:hypothetical protein